MNRADRGIPRSCYSRSQNPKDLRACPEVVYLLTEFLKVMEDPVQEYIDRVMYTQEDSYKKALMLLKNILGTLQNKLFILLKFVFEK